MRNIRFQTPDGEMDLQVSPTLVQRVASRHGIPENAISDMMIVAFFKEASDTAFSRAAAEYLEFDGTDS